LKELHNGDVIVPGQPEDLEATGKELKEYFADLPDRQGEVVGSNWEGIESRSTSSGSVLTRRSAATGKELKVSSS
jgi:hypothetical protein